MKTRWLLFVTLAACAQAELPDDWFEQHRALHLRVDALVARHELDGAVVELQASLEDPAPLGTPAEAVAIVRKDVLFRLASLHLVQHQPEAALAAVDRGLGLGTHRDVFTVNLYLARGRALEALSRRPEAEAAYDTARAMNAD